MDDIPKYRNNRYKTILNNRMEDNKNFGSSDSSEDGKTPIQSPAIKKFQTVMMTKNDIVNQNVTRKLDDNEMNCSSLETLKDYDFYSKSLDEIKLDKTNKIDNSVKDFSKRSTYYSDSPAYSFKKNIDPRNSYLINNDTNLLELSMTISDCDNMDAPYGILNTINMTDTSILSSSNSEAIVQRRQRKKKRGESKKRVSFHEDILKTMKLEDDENFADFSMSFLLPSSVLKRDAQKGRYSWCAHGDSPYMQKNMNAGRNVHSDCYSFSSSSSSAFNGDGTDKELSKLCIDMPCQRNCRCNYNLSLSERGAPEGQEDPGKSLRPKMEIELGENEAQEAYIVEKACGNIVEDPPFKLEMPQSVNPKKYANDWSDSESVTTSDLEERKNNRHLLSPSKKRNMTAILTGESSNKLLAPPLRQAPSKTSLLSRFLKSITERKFEVKKNKKPSKTNTLYIKGIKMSYDSFKDFNDNLDKEIQENVAAEKQEFSGEKISLKLRELFKRHIYRDKTEELYKVYKVRSSYMTNGESKPMIALLTDKTLYLTGSKMDHSYSNQFVIPYNELDVIMVRNVK